MAYSNTQGLLAIVETIWAVMTYVLAIDSMPTLMILLEADFPQDIGRWAQTRMMDG